jgi:hypothetical protein
VQVLERMRARHGEYTTGLCLCPWRTCWLTPPAELEEAMGIPFPVSYLRGTNKYLC